MVSAIEPAFEDQPGWRRIFPPLPGDGITFIADGMNSDDQVLDIIGMVMDEILPNHNPAVAGKSRGGFLARRPVPKITTSIDALLLMAPGRYVAASPEYLSPRT